MDRSKEGKFLVYWIVTIMFITTILVMCGYVKHVDYAIGVIAMLASEITATLLLEIEERT